MEHIHLFSFSFSAKTMSAETYSCAHNPDGQPDVQRDNSGTEGQQWDRGTKGGGLASLWQRGGGESREEPADVSICRTGVGL